MSDKSCSSIKSEVLPLKKTNSENIISAANFITSLRIVGTVVMIITAPLSLTFFIVYSLCGLSDLVDGWIARKTNGITEFGSRLDSIADLFFYIVMIIKILHILWEILPVWFWYVLGGIFLLRVASYTTAAFKFHRFASLHTKMNKICGLLVFSVPYFLALPFASEYCCFVVLFGAAASIHEFYLHLTSKEYHENHKALF